MNKIKFDTLKEERTELFQEVTDYIEKQLPADNFGKEGNIPEVLQWGNLAKVIFVYLLNKQIHTEGMNKKVEDLKNKSFQIEKIKGFPNINKKLHNNIEFIEYQKIIELICKSAKDREIYISTADIIDTIIKLHKNERLNRIYNKKLREGINMEVLLKDILPYTDNIKEDPIIRQHNMFLAEKNLNNNKDIDEQKKLYHELLKKEKNKDIIKFVNQYQIIK